MGIRETTPDPIRPAEVARDDVRVQANRCPFCHTDVDTESDDHLACKGCLARHHASCWEEANACSSCGATEALVAQGPHATERKPHRVGAALSWVVALALLGLMVVGGAAYFGFSSPPTVFASPAPEQPGVAPAAPRPVEALPVEAPRGRVLPGENVQAPLPPPVLVESFPPEVPAGSVELLVDQRTAASVKAFPNLVLAVGAENSPNPTTFTLSDSSHAQSFLLRPGEAQEVTLGERSYRVLFRTTGGRMFTDSQGNRKGTNGAFVWITPLD